MQKEKLYLQSSQTKKISDILSQDGLSDTDIAVILNGEYEVYSNELDLELSFGKLKKHSNILEKLSDDYTIEELMLGKISREEIACFLQMLEERKLTIKAAKAIYQYSIGSNMILAIKRGTKKEAIISQIMEDLERALTIRGVKSSDIEVLKKYVVNTEFGKKPLYEIYNDANDYMRQMGIPSSVMVSVRSAIQSMNRCVSIEQTIFSLEEALSNSFLPKSMKLYRAVKKSYLETLIKDREKSESLVGTFIENPGQTSTSPLYDSSFASLKECTVVFEIYAPKGSRAAYIAELSAYDKTEQEVLLNPNDLYIIDMQTDIIDKNGNNKIVLKALCLSKDRNCYKEMPEDLKKDSSDISKPNNNLQLRRRLLFQVLKTLKSDGVSGIKRKHH